MPQLFNERKSMNFLKQRARSPYVVGTLIGILSWFYFASVDKPLGITTAFEYSAALAVRAEPPRFSRRPVGLSQATAVAA